jgi:hypothetical protein
MVFAAFTVDLGFQQVERRQAQSAADTSALAGAIKAFVSEGDLQAAVDDAIALADTNTRWTINSADWLSCTDSEQLRWTSADLSLSPATECISFSASFDEIRVQLPVAQIDTFFAKVIGINTLPVTAAAQASMELPGGTSTPPFVVLAGASAGNQVCLRESTGGGPDMPGRWVGNDPGTGDGDYDNLEDPLDNDPTQPLLSEPRYLADPCDDLPGTSQFFGTLSPYFYEDANPASNPNTECTQVLSAIDVGIAEGVDHPLASFDPDYPTGSPVRVDGDGCPQGPAVPWPNTMATQTGFTAAVLRCGLLSSNGGTCANGPTSPDGITYDARLQRGFYTGSGARFAGEYMENRTLWSFLRSDMASATVPQSCRDVRTAVTISNPTWDYFDFKEETLDCLSSWTSGQDRLFDDELLTAGRFAVIPVIYEAAFSTSPVHFNSFVPVFFQALYQSGNGQGNPDVMCFSQAEGATGNSGWYRHEAGQPFDCGRSNQNVDRVSAIVLDCGMLAEDKCDPEPGSEPGGEFVYVVLLTR